MNYVQIGREIYQSIQDTGRWALPYRDFVALWQQRTNFESFENDTEKYEALLLAVHGYSTAGGAMMYLSIEE
jgi:hypothetical protein